MVDYGDDRAVRSCDQDSLGELASVGGSAAASIEIAELYRRDTDLLAQIRRDSEAMRRQNRKMRRFQQVQGRLNEALLRGEGVEGIVAAAHTATGRVLVALDHRHAFLAAAGEPADPLGARLIREGLDPELRRRPDIRGALGAIAVGADARLDPAADSGEVARAVVPVLAGEEVLGSLWFESARGAKEMDAELLEQAAQAVALGLMQTRSRVEVETRLQGEFFDDLLKAPTASPALVRRARIIGLDLDPSSRVLVAREGREAVARALAALPRCSHAAIHEGDVIAIVAADLSADEAATELAAAAGRRARGVLAELAGSEADLYGLGEAIRSARRVLDATGEQLSGGVVDLEQARVLALLFGRRDADTAAEFVERCLGPLLEADPDGRLGLVGTLEAYLGAAASPRRTAAALHVHVNTVYYRLKRIRAALGDDLDDPMRTLDLRVACLVHRLTDESSSRAGEVQRKDP